MGEMSDDNLIALFAETGELRHFDMLVRRHIGKTRAMIYPMVLNDADADELTQDVFLRAMKGISRFRRKASFSTWLYRIAMNTTHTFLSRRARNPVEHREEPPDMPDGASMSPVATIMADEADRQVTAALAALSPSLRSAITLTAIHGMSVTEAATADGCLAATMYWRVHQARKILKNKLEAQVSI